MGSVKTGEHWEPLPPVCELSEHELHKSQSPSSHTRLFPGASGADVKSPLYSSVPTEFSISPNTSFSAHPDLFPL